MDNQFEPLLQLIQENNRFVLTAHETPDGDAVGCECALLRALKKLGKTTLIFNADSAPDKFMFADVEDDVQILESSEQLPADIGEYILIIMDTCDTNNIGQVADLLLPHVKKCFIIDHHENEGDLVYDEMVQMDASSTCEILYELFDKLDLEIDFEIAQALYMGIVYDTGSFVYPKTTAQTLQIASDLVTRGVKPNDIYTNLYETNTLSALHLQSKVLATLELVYDGRVAIQTMLKETITGSSARYEEADQLINVPLKAERVKVSIFFKQNLEGLLRCSMRSKGNINVAEIALGFGGGGHRTAAGFKCTVSVEETRDLVLAKLSKYFLS